MENTRRERVLFLNPDSKVYALRVLHRGKVGDPNNLLPLADFICLSGYLHEAGFELFHRDYQTYPDQSMWDYLAENSFDVIIAAYSTFIESDDLNTLRAIHQKYPETKILLLANHQDRLDRQHAEKVLLVHSYLEGMVYDYAYNDIAGFLKGDRSGKAFNILFREGNQIKGETRGPAKDFSIPLPRHEVFKSPRYSHADSVGGDMTVVMTNFGCKFPCSFCWAPALYKVVAHRTPDSLVEEMEHIQKSGFREVYFHDYTFGYYRQIGLEFCQKLAAKKLNIRWFCSSRFDVLTEEMVDAMADAGCKCIEFGIESGNEEVRKKYGKSFPNEQIYKIMRKCKERKIHTAAFLILGLPEEDIPAMKRSIAFFKEIGLDYVAVNTLWAEPNTGVMDKVGEAVEETENIAESMKKINFKHPYASADEIYALYKKTIRDFYLRPSFIFNQIVRLRSPKKFKRLVDIVLRLFVKNPFKLRNQNGPSDSMKAAA